MKTRGSNSQSSGKFVDKYRLGKLLGKGAFGAVYETTSTRSGTKKAVKVMPDSRVGKEELAIMKMVARKREFVCLLDHYHQNGETYFVMELLAPDLAYWLEKKRDFKFNPFNTLKLVSEMIKTLRILHGFGFAHRDVKPDNWSFAVSTGRLALLDFGVADRISNARRSVVTRGTKKSFAYRHCYTSPLGIRENRWSDTEDISALLYVALDCSRMGHLFYDALPAKRLKLKTKLEKDPKKVLKRAKFLIPMALEIYRQEEEGRIDYASLLDVIFSKNSVGLTPRSKYEVGYERGASQKNLV